MKKMLTDFRRVFCKQGFLKLLSAVLCLLLCFYVVPPVLYAEAAEAIGSIGDTDDVLSDYVNNAETEEDTTNYISEVYEITELREESVKHFRREDGSFVAAQYTSPVHYMDDNGTWQDIDNTLTEGSDGTVSNSGERVKFVKKITGNEVIYTLKDKGTKLTLSLDGANKGVRGTVTNGTDAEELTELQKMMNLERLTSSILYENILDGVDIEYVLSSGNIKENIIVKERKESYSYTFNLKLNGLTAALNDDEIRIYDTNGDVKYTIPAPVVYDSELSHAPGDAASYIFVHAGNGKYALTVSVSTEWMNDEARVFPVTVDPVIIMSTSAVQDTYISSTNPSSSYGSSLTLSINSGSYAYWKATVLPSIPTSAYITNAELALASALLKKNGYVAVYEVLTDWDENLTYNDYVSTTSPKGTLGTTVIDYSAIITGDLIWNVTPIAKKWYGGVNYGLALKPPEGYTSIFTCNSSEATADYSSRPALTITYKNISGIEDYQSYSTHSIGIAGTGSVNLATGQLHLAIPTLSTTDSLLSYTPTLMYNAWLAGHPYVYGRTETAYNTSFMPYGFKLSITETLVKKSYIDEAAVTVYYYVYADADGTEHGFHLSSESLSTYVDENGLSMRLVPNSDGTVSITDDSNVTRTFSPVTTNVSSSVLAAWQLTKITDESGNSIQFTFDDQNRPTKVSLVPYGLSAIDMLELYYYSSGMLKMVYNPTSREAVVFRYSETSSGALSTSGKYLRQIDYAHGNSAVTLTNWDNFAMSASSLANITVDATASYGYSGNYITNAVDNLLQQSILYILNGDKVSEVVHYAVGAQGQTVAFTYHTGYTDKRTTGNDEMIYTADDIITRYTFDNEGRAVSVYSFEEGNTEIHGATVGKYETQENVRNNLKEQTVIGGSAVNYLLNGDFEESSSGTAFDNYWFVTGNVYKVNETNFDGEGDYSARISPDLGSTATLSQYVRLTPGAYTLTFPYHTQGCANISGRVTVTSVTGTGFSHSDTISLNENLSNGIKPTFSTSFTIASTDNVKISLEFTRAAADSSATVLEIDRVMLSNNLGGSEFSLVSLGSFDTSGFNYSAASVPVSEYWTPDSSLTVPSVVSGDYPFTNTAQVTGELTSERYVKQRIYEISATDLWNYDYEPSAFYSNAGYSYIVGGFAKAENASLADMSKFRIRVDVIYYQGVNGTDVVVSHSFDFIPSATGWQFAGGSFSTKYEADSSDTNDYRCVKAIDVYCEYSYQPQGYALFDNISVTNATGSDVERYEYYSNGLLKQKDNIFYAEYYEYNSDRNLTRAANNRGEITDYVYTGNKISYSVDYSFTYLSGLDYPINLSNRDSVITKTPKTRTNYTYNTYGLCTAVETFETDASLAQVSGTKKLYNAYSYETTAGSKIFGAMLTESDGLGRDMRYYYDSSTGRLLASVNVDENTGLSYTYDAVGNLTGVMPASYVSATQYSSVTGAENISYAYNANNLLSTITTPSTVYTFTYDVFGNASSVSAGNNTLATYTYNDRNGKLNKITYGNGFIVEYEYNSLELLSMVWYTNNGTKTLAYSYEYTADGQVHSFTDNLSGITTEYKYDVNNRLTGYIEYKNNEVHHTYSSDRMYNDKGQLSSLSYKINYGDSSVASTTYLYSYDSEGRVTNTSLSSPNATGTETYTYDSFGRVVEKRLTYTVDGDVHQCFDNIQMYTYVDSEYGTSNLVATYTSILYSGTAASYTYTYDDNGNITSIVDNYGTFAWYEYDSLGRLAREDSDFVGYTDIYTYDEAGNIISVDTCPLLMDENPSISDPYVTSVRYYENASLGDALTQFGNQAISYDSIGNPTSYRGMSFTWTGRLLTGAVVGDKVMTFTYNDEGIRTSKTVNGITTTYYLDGSRLVGEETNGNVTIYVYDGTGSPIGFQYHGADYAAGEWDAYWYIKNIQGDIVGIYD
ncbi:MAG: hypothetical protein IJW48_05435, partial [Clostridia bacterium]|nr:hypothetical protein [Clostridia bacterium]